MKFKARSKGRIAVDPDRHLTIKDESPSKVEYSGRVLDSLSVVNSVLYQCRFERMTIDSVGLGSGAAVSKFVECSFDGSKLSIVFSGYSRFERCTFRNVDIGEWRGEYAELVDCVFTGRIRRGTFWGRPDRPDKQLATDAKHRQMHGMAAQTEEFKAIVLRRHNDICGNDFAKADLVDVTFRLGVDLSLQSLPSGEDYLYLPDARASVSLSVADVSAWPESVDRAIGLRILDIISEDLEGGQEQLLIRASWFKRWPDAAARLFQSLSAHSIT